MCSRRQRREPAWVAAFLADVSESGVVRHAAERAGVSDDAVWDRARRNSAFHDALAGALAVYAASVAVAASKARRAAKISA